MRMTLHFYGQQGWHDAVRIIGTWEDLRSLRDALAMIVTNHATDSSATFFVNDGEGYAVHIRLETERAMEEYCVPYTADYACPTAQRLSARWPKKPPETAEEGRSNL